MSDRPIPETVAAREPLVGTGTPGPSPIPLPSDPLAGYAYAGGGSTPLSVEQRRALQVAIGDAATDEDAKNRLLAHARKQREQGERAVAASAALAAMQRVKVELVERTRGFVSKIRAVAEDEAREPGLQLLTPRFAGEEREQAVGQLVETVTAIMTAFREQERKLLASYPKVDPPELRDLKVSPEEASTLAVLLAQAPLVRPADFLRTCWNAALALDGVTCVALLPVARSFRDDPRYQLVTGDQPIRGGDPLAVVVEALELVRVTWENHAARIVRKLVPRLHAQAETVAQQIASPPYGWTGLMSARLYRPDGRHALTPDLDPLPGEPTPDAALVPPLDDPDWEVYDKSPYPVVR
jgi:hypothetical protein